jgi:soluble lytic murein transglycosylase-like protein
LAVDPEDCFAGADYEGAMARFATTLVLLLAAVAPAHAAGHDDVPLFDLASVRQLFGAFARQEALMTERDRVASWSDFSLIVDAVLGEESASPLTFEALSAAAAAGESPQRRALAGVAARDEAAYRLLALGYSARETADVVGGRISQHALDTARQMIAVGQGFDAAASYLDTQYRLAIAQRSAPPPATTETDAPTTMFDAVIAQHAAVHNVDPAIVRAMIRAESAFDPRARSRAGAIGLMQLMPATARELGVNPHVPEQNIEGGVRYFAEQLKAFGRVDLALVAYNAGPAFAQRYASGTIALYGETREYVRKVLASLEQRRE